MNLLEIVSAIFITVGIFFLFAGTIGLIRLPDAYCRMHATGKADTLGITLSMAGIALYVLNDGFTLTNILVSLKIMTIAVFWFIANPTATHAIARSAYMSGLKPWTKDDVVEVDLDEERSKAGKQG